jgi:general secretion pathway protein D
VGVALQTSSSTSSSSASGSGSTTTTTSPTLYDLSHLKATDFAVSVGSATANLLLTDSNTKLLQNPRIRATDGQKQTMKIGSKIPIATGSYSSGVAATTVSPLVQTQFQYQDVGVNIEITPTVHFDRDITLKMKIEVTSQSGSVTISGVTEPILSQRVAEQVIRLREGEASILGGIQEKQINEAWNGIPGLSSIPILRYLFGSKDKTVTDDDIVFLVVPHVVRSQSLDASNLRAVDTGVGTTSIDLRHIPSEAPSTAPAAAPAHPAPPARSTMGVVPGVSAEAAAPAALAQMKAAADANGKAAAAAVPNPPPALPFSPAPLAKPAPAADPSGGVSLALNPPSAPAAVGVTFQVPVVLTGGRDIASVPLQIKYDPAKLSLVNVDKGDFLGQDGQAVTLIHSDDPLGSIKIGASRPPGAAGVNGAGVICVLSFQAKTSGDSALSIARPTAVNSAQQQVPAKGGQIDIHVN